MRRLERGGFGKLAFEKPQKNTMRPSCRTATRVSTLTRSLGTLFSFFANDLISRNLGSPRSPGADVRSAPHSTPAKSSTSIVDINNASNSALALARWGGTNLVASTGRLSYQAGSQQLSQVVQDNSLSCLNKLTVASRIVIETEPPPYVLVQKMVF